MTHLSKDRNENAVAASKAAPIPNSVSAQLQKERFKHGLERDNRFWRGVDGLIEKMLAKGVVE